MTREEEQKIYDEAYQKAKEYKDIYYEVSEYCRLPLEGRREIEGLLNQIGEVLKKYGVGFGREHPPMEGVNDFLINWWNTDRRIDFNISNHDTCWLKIIFEPTNAEMEDQWRRKAEDAVRAAKKKEKENEEHERKRQEELREQQEYEERIRTLNYSRRNSDKELHEFVERINTVVSGMLKRTNGWFAEDHCTDVQLKALKKYVDACRVFSDAMNMGLSGLGLYSQNEARTEAHEELLDVFNADNTMARSVTKDIDFVDTWDPISGKYEHLDEDRSIDALAWALLECQED